MKNKIAVRLAAYFASALLVFALIIGGVFLLLFRNSTMDLHKAEMEERAHNISENLSEYFSGAAGRRGGPGQGQAGGYGVYIKFLSDIAMSDVWVVDEKLNILTKTQSGHAEYTFSELPENAGEVVREAFRGDTSFSEGFSNLLNTPTLTVGTPIKSEDGGIIGVVLLHSPVNGIESAVMKGYAILGISIGAALIIALLLSVRFSLIFTRPLKKMNSSAIMLASGDYTVKTDIAQKDEIGELAGNLDVLSEKLLAASKESEKLEQLRKDFVANISHELKTPITVIRASLEALNDGVVAEPDKIKEYYEQMLIESKSLQRLVGDLLDLSRLQNTDFKIVMSRQDLSAIIEDVIRSGRNLADKKSIALNFYNTASDVSVIGDYGRLRQMLMIILDNAIKFSSPGGKIDITLTKSDAPKVSIKDEGPGIEEEELKHIFDRFYKTKSTENKEGTGLGLAIAKQIAVRHNADITAESGKGKGCIFSVEFKNNNGVEFR